MASLRVLLRTVALAAAPAAVLLFAGCSSTPLVEDDGGAGGSDGGSPPTGQICGGLQGATCGAGTYCQFPPDAHCGAADATGVCAAIVPGVCTLEYAPVCGCDGRTYSNACVATRAGTSIFAQGACPDSKACGARAGNTCTANEYCAYLAGYYCGAADAEAVCRPRPNVCDTIYAPVCGCDGQTYASSCIAAVAGSGVLHAGPCAGAGRSCVVGGVTYPDGSGNIPSVDGCNTCSCSDGALACTERACPARRACGGFAGFTCGATEYCAYVEGQLCGAADASATCQPRPAGCLANFDPVCACDGKTYSNACVAAEAGFGVNYKGACAR